jgi:hypothetical protein
MAYKTNMNKSLKQFVSISCFLTTGLLTGGLLTGVEAFAQTKPAPAPATPPTYSFFQGLTFPPYPGTIPRPAFSTGSSAAPIYPIVEVPTPNNSRKRSRTNREQEPAPAVRRKKPRVQQQPEPTEKPIRRRRRAVPRNDG